jgi:prepilin-type N-terminal cleavage/methylation domain-containing protein
MKLSNILRNHQGLTLIEVLVSVTILSTVLLVFLNFFFQAGTYTNMNQKKTVAVNVARNALMYMENQSFLEIKREFSQVNEGMKDSKDHVVKLKICADSYKTFSPGDVVPEQQCKDIIINQIAYEVEISSENVLSPEQGELDYYIPIAVKVRWITNDKEFSTTVDGTVKSEDIR